MKKKIFLGFWLLIFLVSCSKQGEMIIAERDVKVRMLFLKDPFTAKSKSFFKAPFYRVETTDMKLGKKIHRPASVSIFNLETETHYQLNPQDKTYKVAPFPKDVSKENIGEYTKLPKKIDFEALKKEGYKVKKGGTRRIAGEKCIKYELETKSGALDIPVNISTCISDKVPELDLESEIRSAGLAEITSRVSTFKHAKFDPSLFEIPKDYQAYNEEIHGSLDEKRERQAAEQFLEALMHKK